jgi:hypothetical protein
MNAAAIADPVAHTLVDEPTSEGRAKLREVLEPIFMRLGLSSMGLSTLLRTVRIEERPARRRLRSRLAGGETTYLLLDGVVRLQCRVEHRCRPLVVDLIAPGELISVSPEPPGGAARDDLGFYPHGQVLLARFPEVVLRGVLRGASSDCLLDLITELRRAEAHRLADKSRLLVRSVEDRVRVCARALAARFGVAQADGTRIPVALTCADWADLVGCERANATRALLELERVGAIKREGRHVVLVRAR